jgi:hypothetical protein
LHTEPLEFDNAQVFVAAFPDLVLFEFEHLVSLPVQNAGIQKYRYAIFVAGMACPA